MNMQYTYREKYFIINLCSSESNTKSSFLSTTTTITVVVAHETNCTEEEMIMRKYVLKSLSLTTGNQHEMRTVAAIQKVHAVIRAKT